MRDLDELRDVEAADVLKRGARAARLLRRRNAVEFAYEEDYVRAGGAPVATTLPVSREPVVTHAPGALPPFFSGLLPEGRRLSALRAAVKTSADDELTLLLAVGGDPVGDVQVVPHGQGHVDVEPHVVERALDELCDRVDLLIDDLAGLPFDERRLVKLRRAIEYRHDRWGT